MASHEAVERQGRLDAGDLCLVKGPPQTVDGRQAILAVDKDLRHQIVVVRRDPVPIDDPGVDPYAWTRRHDPPADTSGRRGEVSRRVLGRQANLDGMAVRIGGARRSGQCNVRQRAAGRKRELLVDDIQTHSQLCDAVLDLQTGIDLEEVERAIGRAQEFRGRRIPQASCRADPDRELMQVASLRDRQPGCRGLFEEFLVAPLE